MTTYDFDEEYNLNNELTFNEKTDEDIVDDDIALSLEKEEADVDLDESRQSRNLLNRLLASNFLLSKTFTGLCISFFVLDVLLALFIKYGMFHFKVRDLSDENIFKGNDLIISDEVLDSIVSEIEQELDITVLEEDFDSFCLLNAVLKNENLTDDEKKVFYQSYKIIKDNPFIDKEAAYTSLLNVDVTYKKKSYVYDKNVQGVYSPLYEEIGIFGEDYEHKKLLHEIVHCIFSNERTKYLPTYFKEGMTELLVNEYFSEEPFCELNNYPFEIAMVKMLCEVSTPEAVLKAYSTGNMSVITEDIAMVFGDEGAVIEAFDAVDLLMRQYRSDVLEEDKVDNKLLINGFSPLFKEVISCKYNNNDIESISYNYNEMLLSNILKENSYDGYIEDLSEFGYIERAYFSSSLKDFITFNKENQKIKLMENNR